VRAIGVVTVGRSDYGILLPILRRIQDDSDLKLRLIVAGMHLSQQFGMTVDSIEADGIEISDRVDMLQPSDSPVDIAGAMAAGTAGFAQVFSRSRPDILVVLGDRFEMHAAAVAATPFNIPVAHIHGGEVTEGAIDELFRHSMTKLSHLHFVATEEFEARLLQMGEEPWRIVISGAPGLDNLKSINIMDRRELARTFGIDCNSNPLLVTFHPVTLEQDQTEWQFNELLQALDECGQPTVFTMPNADTNGRMIASMISDFVASRPEARFVTSFGTRGYFGLMSTAIAMVGNSSSGIIEASSFELPVVNIGTRQSGRLRSSNVIDVAYGKEAIAKGITSAVDPSFKLSLIGMANPYGSGNAAEKIVIALKETELGDRLLRKRFCWIPEQPFANSGSSLLHNRIAGSKNRPHNR